MQGQGFSLWCATRGVHKLLGPDQVQRLAAFLEILEKWNGRLNLTGFSLLEDLDTACDRLILEPVLAAVHLRPTDRLVIDIGSGSGSPAIPFLIAAPWIDLTMVESRQRKSVFLREAIRAVGHNASVVTARFEEFASSHPGGQFDVATIRGVRLDAAIETGAAALVQPKGRVFYFDSVLAPTPSLAGFPVTSHATFESLVGFQLSIFERP